jgi:multiple sugar transport system ATP-binding protein
LQVYGEPANKFVAGFIGAPSMNFLEVIIRAENGSLIAEAPLLRVRVAEQHTQALAAWTGQKVILGVRPEHLSINSGSRDSIGKAEVEVIEQLGSEIVLESRLGDQVLTVARVDPQAAVARRDVIDISILNEKMHFFDPQTEQAIR